MGRFENVWVLFPNLMQPTGRTNSKGLLVFPKGLGSSLEIIAHILCWS